MFASAGATSIAQNRGGDSMHNTPARDVRLMADDLDGRWWAPRCRRTRAAIARDAIRQSFAQAPVVRPPVTNKSRVVNRQRLQRSCANRPDFSAALALSWRYGATLLLLAVGRRREQELVDAVPYTANL
jgi:hypothetical protein